MGNQLVPGESPSNTSVTSCQFHCTSHSVENLKRNLFGDLGTTQLDGIQHKSKIYTLIYHLKQYEGDDDPSSPFGWGNSDTSMFVHIETAMNCGDLTPKCLGYQYVCVCLCVCACMRLHAQRSGPVAMNQIDWRDKNGARNKMRPTSQMFNKVNKFNFTVNKSRKQQLAVSVLHFQGEDSLLKSIMMA